MKSAAQRIPLFDQRLLDIHMIYDIKKEYDIFKFSQYARHILKPLCIELSGYKNRDDFRKVSKNNFL